MKTARFSKVVQKAGKPESHLVLTRPEEDSTLRKAIKEHRVMTVFQEAVGHRTDRGHVGFDSGNNRQFLIFPKSLRSFEGSEIVGIKYDLVEEKEIPKSQRATAPKVQRAKKKPVKELKKVERTEESPAEEQSPSSQKEDVTAIKKQIRRAMELLEDGKAVAAFNLLKQIQED